jgi:hypothetical protein
MIAVFVFGQEKPDRNIDEELTEFLYLWDMG